MRSEATRPHSDRGRATPAGGALARVNALDSQSQQARTEQNNSNATPTRTRPRQEQEVESLNSDLEQRINAGAYAIASPRYLPDNDRTSVTSGCLPSIGIPPSMEVHTKVGKRTFVSSLSPLQFAATEIVPQASLLPSASGTCASGVPLSAAI